MRYRKVLIIFWFLCHFFSPVIADEIFFKNGDKLTGTIKQLSGGKVAFSSEHIGQLTMEASTISTLTNNYISFINGDVLSGKVEELVGGKLIFQSRAAGLLTIDTSHIDGFIAKEPIKVSGNKTTIAEKQNEKEESLLSKAVTADEAESQQPGRESSVSPEGAKIRKPKWSGSISAGLTSTHGNTSTDNVNFSANLLRRTEDERWTMAGDYARSRQENPDTGKKETTEDWWRTKAKYDYFLTKKFYVYGDGRYEKDAIAELDRRVILGSGGGYQWIEFEDMKFSTEAGLASLYEKFDNQTESKSELSAQLGYHFDKKLIKGIKFLNDLTYYPSTEELSDYYLTSTAEIRASMTEKMFLNFKIIFDHDETPASGASKTDVKYIFGLGYEF